MLAALLAVAAAALSLSESLWKWDLVLYDFTLRSWQRPAPDDIVIVAIDQQSLDDIGRWPWPRHIHARLLDRLAEYQSGPVALDVIFSEPDRDGGDMALASAAGRHGRVVLPVVFEKTARDGRYIELLPFPALDERVEIGHADMPLDLDGLARSLYLRAGIDDPFWPALALRLLRLRDPAALPQLPGLRHTPGAVEPQTTLVRDHQIWLAYAGPPGHFRALSYNEVLAGRVEPQALRGKTVLVGFTAIGQDNLPTPVSGEHRPMPGVEIHANALDTLARGLWLLPLPLPWTLALTIACALLPLLFYPRLSPRWAPAVAASFFALPLLCSLLLLHGMRFWFPPAAAMLSVTLGYLLWSGRRLQTTLRYLNQELERLNREPMPLSQRSRNPQLAAGMEFIRHALPLRGCVLLRPDGAVEQHWGEAPATPTRPRPGGWLRTGDVWWQTLPAGDGEWYLGVRWQPGSALDPAQLALLDDLVAPYLRDPDVKPLTPIEYLQERIQQVQTASDRMRALRAFIDRSMTQMSGGMLVADGLGKVLLDNPKAALYLEGSEDAPLTGRHLPELFGRLEFVGAHTWSQVLAEVMVELRPVRLGARSREGYDLLIELAPFFDPYSRALGRGLIINFSDISPLRASERRRAEMLSFLSHDLRSPLASIMALTQLARYRPERLRDGSIVDQIEDRTEAILDLVDDFLQLSRAESSDEIELGEIDLVPLLEDAIEQLQPLIDARGTHVRTEYRCEQAWLLGHPGLLRRLFVNLLSNAIKYSPEHSEIRFGLERRGEAVRCWVADSGYGIAAEHLPKLFDRFQRIHRQEHKQEQGSGLGLAFVKTVVDRHHGRIEVDSVLNQGTEFVLHFPLLETAETAMPA